MRCGFRSCAPNLRRADHEPSRGRPRLGPTKSRRRSSGGGGSYRRGTRDREGARSRSCREKGRRVPRARPFDGNQSWRRSPTAHPRHPRLRLADGLPYAVWSSWKGTTSRPLLKAAVAGKRRVDSRWPGRLRPRRGIVHRDLTGNSAHREDSQDPGIRWRVSAGLARPAASGARFERRRGHTRNGRLHVPRAGEQPAADAPDLSLLWRLCSRSARRGQEDSIEVMIAILRMSGAHSPAFGEYPTTPGDRESRLEKSPDERFRTRRSRIALSPPGSSIDEAYLPL